MRIDWFTSDHHQVDLGCLTVFVYPLCIHCILAMIYVAECNIKIILF